MPKSETLKSLSLKITPPKKRHFVKSEAYMLAKKSVPCDLQLY